jgi:hypothetical protein
MIWTELMGAKPLEPALPTLAAWALVALVTATSMGILALRVRAREISR